MTPATASFENPHDHDRAQQYEALALLLGQAPSAAVLAHLSEVQGAPETPLGAAWDALAAAAGESDAASVAREFFTLFVGVGRGELLPYASFYLTGFLHERPLAELRGDLARLGLARQADDHDPEDRVAMVLAVMAAYARGDLPTTPDAPSEAQFFARHLQPWLGVFFDDLAQAPAARFYTSVARIGRLLIDTDIQAFALEGEGAHTA